VHIERFVRTACVSGRAIVICQNRLRQRAGHRDLSEPPASAGGDRWICQNRLRQRAGIVICQNRLR